MSSIDDTLGLSVVDELSKDMEKSNVTVHDGKSSVAKQIEEYSDNDYLFTRESLISIVESGEDAINSVLEIAKSSQDSKDFEAFAKIVTALVKANSELSNISREKRKEVLSTEEPKNSTGKQTVNNTFIGTTKDLNEMIKQKREAASADVIDAEVTKD